MASLSDDLIAESRRTSQKAPDPLAQELIDASSGASRLPAVGPVPGVAPHVSYWDFMSHLPMVGPSIEQARQDYLEPGARMFHEAAQKTTGMDIGKLVPQLANDPQIGDVTYNVLRGLPATMAALPLEMEAQLAHSMPENIATLGAGTAGKALGVFPAMAKYLRNVPGADVLTSPLEDTTLGKPLHAAYKGVQNVLSGILHPYGGWSETGEQAIRELEGAKVHAAIRGPEIGKELQEGGTGRALPRQEQVLMRRLMENPELRDQIHAMDAANAPLNSAALQEMFNTSFKIDTARPDVTGFEVPRNLTLPVQNYNQIASRAAEALGMTKQGMIDASLRDPAFFARYNDLNYSPDMYRGQKWGIMPPLPQAIRENASFLKMRKALTSAKRAELGYIEEPGGPTALRLIQEQRLIDTRKFFETMATDPNVSRFPMTPGEMDLPPKMTMDTGVGKFTKMPQSDALGPLSGKMVAAPEAKTILGMHEALSNQDTLLRDVYTSWRFGKTVLSPATWMRVTFGHAMMAHAAGVSPFDLDTWRRAVQEYTSGRGPYWDMAGQHPVPASWVTKGAGSALNEVLTNADMRRHDVHSIYDGYALATSRWLRHNPASEWMKQGYHDMQGLPKHAVFIKAVEDGVPVGEAIQKAEKAIIHYGEVPEWVKKSRTSPAGIPFLSFSYGVAPRIVQAVTENPMIFQAYHQFAKAWNVLSSESAQVTPEEKQQIEANYPNAMPMVMPFRNAAGHLLVHDVTPMTPVRDAMEIAHGMFGHQPTGESGTMQALTNALGTAAHIATRNPFASTVAGLATGVNPTFGNTFASPLGGAQQLADLTAEHGAAPRDLFPLTEAMQHREVQPRLWFLLNQVMPPPLGQNLENVWHAAHGRTNMIGLQQTVPEALGAALLGPTRDVQLDSLMRDLKFKSGAGEGKKDLRRELIDISREAR